MPLHFSRWSRTHSLSLVPPGTVKPEDTREDGTSEKRSCRRQRAPERTERARKGVVREKESSPEASTREDGTSEKRSCPRKGVVAGSEHPRGRNERMRVSPLSMLKDKRQTKEEEKAEEALYRKKRKERRSNVSEKEKRKKKERKEKENGERSSESETASGA